MNMIDEKDPRQESVKADSSDDEVIIDLTEEVIIKTEDDNGIFELTEDLAEDEMVRKVYLGQNFELRKKKLEF